MLCFLPWDALLLLVCGSFSIFVFNNWKACSTHIRWLTSPLKYTDFFFFFALRNAWFSCVWLESSSFSLWSAVRSILQHLAESEQRESTAPLALIHAHALTLPSPCLIGNVLCFESRAVSVSLYTFLFPSFWYKFNLV